MDMQEILTRYFPGVPHMVGVGSDFMDHEFSDTSGAADPAAQWRLTAVGSSTAARAGLKGGVMRLTTGATAANSASIQHKFASVFLDVKEKSLFVFRVKVDDITNSILVFGLANIDTTLNGGVTDGILVKSADTVDTLTVQVTRDSSAVTAGTLNNQMVDATYMTVALLVTPDEDVDGKATITVFQDQMVNEYGQSFSVTNLPYDALMTPSFEVISGAGAGAKNFDIDYYAFRFAREA